MAAEREREDEVSSRSSRTSKRTRIHRWTLRLRRLPQNRIALTKKLPRIPNKARRRQLYKSPALAALGVVFALLALIDPAWSFIEDAFKSDIEVKNLPVSFNPGQPSELNYVIPRPLDQISRPPARDTADPKALSKWLIDNKAVAADRLDVNFIARSEEVEPTLITNARVVVTDRSEPVSGTRVSADSGGNQPVRVLTADLDARPPRVSKPSSWKFPLKITQADAEIFSVAATAKTCDCQWVIELDILDSKNEVRTVTVDDNGKPFRVTSSVGATQKTSLPADATSVWPS